MENELRMNISTDYINSTSRDVMLESIDDTCDVQEMLHHSLPTMDVKSCKNLPSKEIISRPDVNDNYLGPRNTFQTAASQIQDDPNDYLLFVVPTTTEGNRRNQKELTHIVTREESAFQSRYLIPSSSHKYLPKTESDLSNKNSRNRCRKHGATSRYSSMKRSKKSFQNDYTNGTNGRRTRDDSDDSPRSIKAWDAEESHISCLSRQDKDNVYCDSYGASHKNKIIFKLSNSDSLLSTDLSMNKAVSLDKNGIRNDTHKTDYNKTRDGIADWSTIAHNPMGHVGNMEYNSYLNECVPHYASNNLNEMVSKRSMREKMLPTEIRVKRRRAANARERKRVNKITDAFERLREHVPNLIKDRKLSKFETLQMAMAYIDALDKGLRLKGSELEKETHTASSAAARARVIVAQSSAKWRLQRWLENKLGISNTDMNLDM